MNKSLDQGRSNSKTPHGGYSRGNFKIDASIEAGTSFALPEKLLIPGLNISHDSDDSRVVWAICRSLNEHMPAEMPLTKFETTIGRRNECDIVVKDVPGQEKIISGLHLSICRDAETGKVWVKDFSLNGTFINSTKKFSNNPKEGSRRVKKDAPNTSIRIVNELKDQDVIMLGLMKVSTESNTLCMKIFFTPEFIAAKKQQFEEKGRNLKPPTPQARLRLSKLTGIDLNGNELNGQEGPAHSHVASPGREKTADGKELEVLQRENKELVKLVQCALDTSLESSPGTAQPQAPLVSSLNDVLAAAAAHRTEEPPPPLPTGRDVGLSASATHPHALEVGVGVVEAATAEPASPLPAQLGSPAPSDAPQLSLTLDVTGKGVELLPTSPLPAASAKDARSPSDPTATTESPRKPQTNKEKLEAIAARQALRQAKTLADNKARKSIVSLEAPAASDAVPLDPNNTSPHASTGRAPVVSPTPGALGVPGEAPVLQPVPPAGEKPSEACALSRVRQFKENLRSIKYPKAEVLDAARGASDAVHATHSSASSSAELPASPTGRSRENELLREQKNQLLLRVAAMEARLKDAGLDEDKEELVSLEQREDLLKQLTQCRTAMADALTQTQLTEEAFANLETALIDLGGAQGMRSMEKLAIANNRTLSPSERAAAEEAVEAAFAQAQAAAMGLYAQGLQDISELVPAGALTPQQVQQWEKLQPKVAKMSKGILTGKCGELDLLRNTAREKSQTEFTMWRQRVDIAAARALDTQPALLADPTWSDLVLRFVESLNDMYGHPRFTEAFGVFSAHSLAATLSAAAGRNCERCASQLEKLNNFANNPFYREFVSARDGEAEYSKRLGRCTEVQRAVMLAEEKAGQAKLASLRTALATALSSERRLRQTLRDLNDPKVKADDKDYDTIAACKRDLESAADSAARAQKDIDALEAQFPGEWLARASQMWEENKTKLLAQIAQVQKQHAEEDKKLKENSRVALQLADEAERARGYLREGSRCAWERRGQLKARQG